MALLRSLRLTRLGVLASISPLIFVVILGLLTVRNAAAAALASCEASPPPVDVKNLGTITARVRVQQPDELVFQFDDRRDVGKRDMSVEFIDEPTLLDAAVRPGDGELLAFRSPRLVDRTTNSQIPSDKIHARAVFSGSERAVSFEICVDLHDPVGFGPGSYEGVGALTDPRFVEVDVPVRVTLKSGGWFLPLSAALGGGALGAVWGTLSPVATNIERTGLSPSLRRQAFRLLAISLLLGAGAGYWVYVQKYTEIPTFRGFTRDWVTVGTAAFLGAATLYPIAAVIESVMRLFGKGDREQRARRSPRPEPSIDGLTKGDG